MSAVVAVADHRPPARPPLQVAPGDAVEVGERSPDWPAFVLVRAAAGEGWVPERFLDGGRPAASVLVAYDTTELSVDAGDRIELLEDDEASAWAWCRRASGEEGWVPHSALRPVRIG